MEHAAGVEQQVTMALRFALAGCRTQAASSWQRASPCTGNSFATLQRQCLQGLSPRTWRTDVEPSTKTVLALRLWQWCQSPPVFARWRYPPAPPDSSLMHKSHLRWLGSSCSFMATTLPMMSILFLSRPKHFKTERSDLATGKTWFICILLGCDDAMAWNCVRLFLSLKSA